MESSDMRRRFEKAVENLLSNKRTDNKSFLSLAEYNKRIIDVKQSKVKFKMAGSKRTTRDYRLVRKYDVRIIDGKEKLIKPIDSTVLNIRYYVTNEDLFDIIHTTHSSIGHGGRNRMISELKTNYCNITNETIMIYLRLCVMCQKNSNYSKKRLSSKPILHSALSSSANIDLIDMQSQSYNNFRFIMVYQDNSTGFVLLKPLKTKRAKETALNLLEIYTTFGAPAILQSDNNREFVSAVLTEFHLMWDGIKIVHGKPKHNQSRRPVERANKDVEDMLSAWMEEKKSMDWPTGLKFVQFQKNIALNSGIGRSPYEATFGCSARIGLVSVGIPQDEIAQINTEEDIEAIMGVPSHDIKTLSDEEELDGNIQFDIRNKPGPSKASVVKHEEDNILS